MVEDEGGILDLISNIADWTVKSLLFSVNMFLHEITNSCKNMFTENNKQLCVQILNPIKVKTNSILK